MFLLFIRAWLIILYRAAFCKTKEITPVEVFEADYLTLPSEPLLGFIEAKNSDN